MKERAKGHCPHCNEQTRHVKQENGWKCTVCQGVNHDE